MSDTTKWQCSVDPTTSGGPTAALTVSVNGGAATAFAIKGICYSPCPIGGSNAYGPNIGDWFWDSFDGVTNWSGTWSNDLPLIKALGANVIRVYCFLDTQLPPASQSQVFTHTDFLDACYANGLFVIIGIPLPQQLFVINENPQPSATWWTDVLQLTVTEVANHPAVLGFTIANEVDNGSVDTYGPTANATYWWDQVQAMAVIAKTAAPDKLVGIANHDDPGICANAASYMATCPSIDYWGVNTYQPQSFTSVFGGNGVTGYATLTGAALKPVILTEYGFPATSRLTANTLDPTQIYWNTTTAGQVATVLNSMLPAAYAEQLNLGVCYFEFCDEWWNQSGYVIAPNASCPGATGPNAPAGGVGGSFTPPNVYTQYGGPIACGFPNYYWDNDGFGLNAVAVGEGRNPENPWDPTTNAPALPLDTRTPRDAVVTAVTAAFLQCTVQARHTWQDTGIAIAPGSFLTIAYLSGLWTADPQTNNGQLYDANGCPGVTVTQPGYPLQNVNMGALVGQVGDNPIFLIGDGPTVTPTGQSGVLKLCINDDLNGLYGAGLTDNSGSVIVQITM